MPAFLGIGPDNPIAWCNFYRKGGFKSLLWTAGAYSGILACLIFLSAGLDGRDSGRSIGGWTMALMALQFLFVVVIGAGRVSATIRGDTTSGMIESLRMMPLAAGHAVAGYLCAAFASLFGFFAANFLLGLVVNAMAELPAGRWLAANGILLAFALFVWTVVAFLAFLVKGSGAVLVVVGVVGVIGNAGILYVAPGLVVLAGPLIGGSVFNSRSAQTELAMPLVISLAAQFLVGAIFFAGAARKYRRPDALALGGWLGLALLLAFIGISLLATLQPEAFQPGYLAREFQSRDAAIPFCGSTILALAVALIPLSNFARLHVGWVRGRIDDPDRRRTVPPPFVAGLIVTAALALMILAFPAPPDLTRLACIVAALFGFCVSATFVAAWFYRAVDNAKVVLCIWLVGYCLVPLAVDYARYRLSDHDRLREDPPALATIASLSPVGLLIESATQEEPELRPGAIFHTLIPLLPIGLYLRAGRRKALPRLAP